MSLLLALAGAVAPPDPDPPEEAGGGGGGYGQQQTPPLARTNFREERDMQDIQAIITALFALDRIF